MYCIVYSTGRQAHYFRMVTLKQRRKIKEWIHSRITLAVLFILVVLMVTPVWNMYERYDESERLLAETEERASEIRSQKERIERQIQFLESDLGQERELRQRFMAGREGEQVAVILESQESFEYEEEEEGADGFLQAVGSWIGGLFSVE